MREINQLFRGKQVRVQVDCLNAFTQSDSRDVENEYSERVSKVMSGELREQIIRECAKVCRDYAHSDLKPSQMRRQVAYACEARILKLLEGI